MTESYPIKPCLDCGFNRPQVVTFTDNKILCMAIRCPECDKSTDGFYTTSAAVDAWDNDKERLLAPFLRRRLKKMLARHTWRTNKKDYLP